MQTFRKLHLPATLLSAIAMAMVLSGVIGSATSAEPDPIALGKAITFDRTKGNCLACHIIEDGELPGNIAPPLVSMTPRFPDKVVLRAQIWDATVKNPESVMPPYGRHRILTEHEIDLVVNYLYTL